MSLGKQGNNPLVVLHYLLRGTELLTHKALRLYIVIPLLINTVLYSLAIWVGYHYVNSWILSLIPDWLHWLHWLLSPILLVSFIIIGFFTFTVVANVIAAPFYGKLSAKVSALYTASTPQNDVELPLSQVMKAEFKRLRYVLSRTIPLLILFIIPGINLVAPVLWMVFGAWVIALEYFAYPLENKGILFVEQHQFSKKIGLGTLSFGALTMLGLSIPIVNIFVAPAAVIGATLFIHAIED